MDDKILYYDEDKETNIEMTKEEFVNNKSWDLPYEFVLEQANLNEDMRTPLYHQLLRRSKTFKYVGMLKESPYYSDLYKEIIEGENVTDKIDLALYFDNSLIDSLFGGLDNVIEKIIETKQEDDSYINSAAKLSDISRLATSDDTISRINEGIDILVDKEYESENSFAIEYGFQFTNIDEINKYKEATKQALHSGVINHNKTK